MVESIAAISLLVALLVWPNGMDRPDHFECLRLKEALTAEFAEKIALRAQRNSGRFTEVAFSVISSGDAFGALSGARPRHAR
jgi:hypothetical protein